MFPLAEEFGVAMLALDRATTPGMESTAHSGPTLSPSTPPFATPSSESRSIRGDRLGGLSDGAPIRCRSGW